MIKLFLALLYLSSPTLQTCSTGCLKCSTTLNDSGQSACLLCDQTQGFYLDGQSCKSSQDESCLKFGLVGNCELCESNYYFDPNANRCLPVPQSKTIDNCQYYNPDTTCRMCNPGFLIQTNTCVKIDKPIANCAFQTVATECVECIANYYLAQDFKSCKKIPLQENCLSYSDIECQKCKTNYLYDKNVYQRQLIGKLDSGDTQGILDHIELEFKNQYLFDTSIKKCEKITISDCSEYTRFDQCKICNAGYYLNLNKKCIVNPQPRIDSCLVYTSLKNCKECKNGYYRKNALLCEKIKPSDHIQRCQKYSSTKSIVQCVKCEQEFYLQDNICKARVNQPIKNCQTYDVDEDVCGTCDSDYVLSSDRLQCLQQILNCDQHKDFSSGSLQEDLQCIKCVQSHYLLNGVCVQGTQQNCNNFLVDADQCTQCQNGFFSIPECIEQSAINECETYSKDSWNKCDKCSAKTLNLRVENMCEQLPEISNCEQYINNSKLKKNLCSKCQDGYYRDNSLHDQRCLSIQTSNCATAEDNTGKCLTCKSGYGLALNKKSVSCKAPFQALTTYCKDDGIVQSGDNTNNFQCNKCKENATPLVNSYNVFPPFCVSTDRLNLLPKYFDKPTTFKTINNCVQYTENDGEYPECIKCSKGYFISMNGKECISNYCRGSDTAKKTFSALKHRTLGTRNYIQPNRCESDEQDNYVKGPKVNGTANINSIILSCKHKLKQVDLSDEEYSNVNPNNLEKNWIEHFLDVHSKVTCPNSTTQATINGGSLQDITQDIPTCHYFYLTDTANDYRCLRCSFGQQFSETPSTGNDFLSSCRSMSSCDNSVQYKNINLYWHKLFSCHKCKTTNEIPIIAYEADAQGNQTFDEFKPFSLSNHNWTGTTSDRSSQLFCMNVEDRSAIISKLSLGTTYETGNGNAAKLEVLPNCGLAFLNLQYSNSFDNTGAMQSDESGTPSLGGTNQALICAQCKPGYEIFYYGGTKVARYCKVIDGCDYTQVQTWFNGCSQCESGKTYKYDQASGTINWNRCITYPNTRVEYQNCLAWEIDGDEGECKVCKKGYVLNSENHHCEILTVPTCTTNVFRNTNIDVLKNSAYFLYLNQHGQGCHTCNSGMVNIAYHEANPGEANKFFPNLTICVQSNLVKHETNFQDLLHYSTGTTFKKSFYINHCLIYEVTRSSTTFTNFDTHKCNQCASGYIIRDGGKKCEAESSSTNCMLLHETDQNCLKCKEGYAIQRSATGIKVCVQGSISNCLEYYREVLFTSVRCKTCEVGYYFKDGKCIEGKVPNCNKFESDFICTECNENYWLVGEADSNNDIAKGYYCLKKDPALNCKTAYFTGLRLHCKECINDSMKLKDNDLTQSADENVNILQTKCLEYSPITNCEVHSTQFLLKKKSLYCDKCNKNYYVQDDGYSCKKRSNFQDSCTEYVANEDKCSKCMTGYFLNTNTYKCEENPIGDLGCRKYSYLNSTLKCLSCGDGQYLDDTICKKVSIDNKIPQCQYYKSQTKCESCYSGFYLNNNLCNNITVDHCVEYVNENSCKVCKDGYRLLDQGEITICEKYDKLNCVKFNQETLVCEVCDQSFFPDDDGNCVQVVPDNLILNCEQYRKDQLCAKCTSQHVLSLDLKMCNAKGSFDEHCIQQRKIDIWDCNVCKTGFRFVGEICKTYGDSIQGCFIRDVNNSKKCAICQSGYYMERGQNCAKNV